METKPIVYNRDHYTVIANDIIKGRQDMSLQEARIVRLLVTQVVKQDKDIKTYSCKVQELADFLGIPSSNLYRDVRQLCEGLMKLIIRIGTGNPKEPWEIWHWIQLARYDGNGTITLRLSDEIKPHVLELNKWFTQYQLGNILSMRSYYAIRLYELIKCQDGIGRESKDYYDFTMDELRVFFNCEEKYKRFSQFIEKVITIAINEINEKTDIELEVVYIKKGRAVTALRFYVHVNRKQQLSLFDK